MLDKPAVQKIVDEFVEAFLKPGAFGRWREEDHPREPDGKFASVGGTSAVAQGKGRFLPPETPGRKASVERTIKRVEERAAKILAARKKKRNPTESLEEGGPGSGPRPKGEGSESRIATLARIAHHRATQKLQGQELKHTKKIRKSRLAFLVRQQNESEQEPS